ncbi:unnamed protein product, partial [Gulo gulo]
ARESKGSAAALLVPYEEPCGQGSCSCHIRSNWHGLIQKYGLKMCSQCFHQYVKDRGFSKVN